MNKGLSIALVAVFVLTTLGMTLFMPLSELGLINATNQIPQQARELADSLGLMNLCQAAYDTVMPTIKNAQNDPNFSYYVYSLFLGLAMVAAAIGINVVGREESEEKTILPIKK